MGYIVALTGGIGSGKSTIASTFSCLNVKVIDTDIIARQVVEPNTPALQAIVTHFGNDLLNHDGTLNRRTLREYIFTDPTEKIWLNSLIHPLIYQETQNQMSLTDSPYVLWVIPLLIENQLVHQANRILVVDVLPQTQLYRTMVRDHVSRQHVEYILAAQATREARLAIADDIIDNDKDNDGVSNVIISEISRLHEYYTTLAAQVIV